MKYNNKKKFPVLFELSKYHNFTFVFISISIVVIIKIGIERPYLKILNKKFKLISFFKIRLLTSFNRIKKLLEYLLKC